MNKIRIGPSDGKERVSNESSVIVLHQFPRTSRAPNGSPFPIKVETFLRMNKLEYVSDFKNFFGPKGKSPWITDSSGKPVADSEFIIQHLIREHELQMPDLTPEEKAVALGMRSILEDNLYFVLSAENCIYGDLGKLVKMFPRVVHQHKAFNLLQSAVVMKMKWTLGRQAKAQGIGLHSQEEIRTLGIADLEAVSSWLGEKLFMMGPLPCALDCSTFGFLAVLFYNYPEDHYFRSEAEKRFPNLKMYAERMRETFWPDWDDILAKEVST